MRRRPLTLEDFKDDAAGHGPMFRAWMTAKVAELKGLGFHGESLQLAVEGIETARQAPGTGEHFRLLEQVRAHQRQEVANA